MKNVNSTAADKLLLTLLAFEKEPEWQLGNLAKYLQLPKSTVHRVLDKLKQYEFVEQDVETNAYRLGSRAWQLALVARPYEALRRMARPYLEKLFEASQETAFLTVAEGVHSLCIDRIEGLYGLRLSMQVGVQAPLHIGASNLILLAYLPSEEQRVALSYWLPDTSKREALCDELKTIRKQGFVYTNAQLTPGVAALAVPVLGKDQTILIGLSLGGYSERFTKQVAMQALPKLREAGFELSKKLQANLGARSEVCV